MTEIATPPDAAPATLAAACPRPIKVASWLLLVSALLCLALYLALSVKGGWLTSAPTLRSIASDLVVNRGSTQLRPEGLMLVAADPSGTSIVSIKTSLRSSDYPVVAWETLGVPEQVEVALLWQNNYEPGRIFNRRLEVEAGRVQPYSLENDPNWKGVISGLALGIKGSFSEPITLRGVTVKTMSAREVVGDRVREWLTFEPWTGSTINTVLGGADVQDLPISFSFAIVVALAGLIYATLARWRPQWVGSAGALVVGGMFVAAWFVVDARWQWNLLRQAAITADRYGGLTWRERHLAAEDGMVFAFIEKVRAKLPPPPARVFMVGDEHYFRDRGAYHLYPYNVFFSPWVNAMPPSSAVRPGDYMVVFQRRGVQYDPAAKLLRWEGNAPVAAELLLAEGGAALFKFL